MAGTAAFRKAIFENKIFLLYLSSIVSFLHNTICPIVAGGAVTHSNPKCAHVQRPPTHGALAQTLSANWLRSTDTPHDC